LKVSDKVLKIKEKIFEKNHPKIIEHYLFVGYLHFQKKEYDKAIASYQKSLNLGIDRVGKGNINLARIYIGLAKSFQEKREFDKAISFYNIVLDIYLKKLGESHPAVATTYNSLGALYVVKGEVGKGLEFYAKALPMARKYFDENHQIVQMILKNIELAKGFKKK